MLRVTRQTDYAVVLLSHIVRLAPTATHAARELAEATHLPLPMVSKILKALARNAVLTSERGVKGGYRLTRPPAAISVAEVIATFEGPIAITACGTGSGECEHETSCSVSGNWQRLNQVIRSALEGVTLADMAHSDNPGLVNLRSYTANRPAASHP